LCRRSISATSLHARLREILIIIGVVTAVIGPYFLERLRAKMVGRLPATFGSSAQLRLLFPIVTCIVISILLSLILSIFRR